MDDLIPSPNRARAANLLAVMQTHAILLASAFMVVVATAYGMVPHA